MGRRSRRSHGGCAQLQIESAGLPSTTRCSSRALALLPQRGAVDDAIAERSAVARSLRSSGRGMHTNSHSMRVARHAHRRIAVSAHVDERQVRRQIGIRKPPRALRCRRSLHTRGTCARRGAAAG